jgi:hypothetical protein
VPEASQTRRPGVNEGNSDYLGQRQLPQSMGSSSWSTQRDHRALAEQLVRLTTYVASRGGVEDEEF